MIKKTMIAGLITGFSLMSTIYATEIPGLQYLQLQKKALTKTQISQANDFIRNNASYFTQGTSASIGVMSVMNNAIYNAPTVKFNGTCTANVSLANNSALTALNAVNKVQFKPSQEVAVGKDNISVGAVEGLLVAASTAVEANTVAINTFNKCNESSNAAMQYLNDILVVGTTALTTLHPPA